MELLSVKVAAPLPLQICKTLAIYNTGRDYASVAKSSLTILAWVCDRAVQVPAEMSISTLFAANPPLLLSGKASRENRLTMSMVILGTLTPTARPSRQSQSSTEKPDCGFRT